MGQQSCSSEELAFAGADLEESSFSSVIPIRVSIPYPAFLQKISPAEKLSETSFGAASSISCWHSEFLSISSTLILRKIGVRIGSSLLRKTHSYEKNSEVSLCLDAVSWQIDFKCGALANITGHINESLVLLDDTVD